MNTDQTRDKAAELRDKATEKLDELAEKTGEVLGDLRDRGRELIDRHEGSIDSTIDKVAGFVDEQTKGRYHDKIESAAGKAKVTVERLAANPSEGGPTSGPGTT